MMDDLDDIPWGELQHAFGAASDVPSLLRSLGSGDRQVRDAALTELWNNIWHQGTVYEATPFALPFLIRLLQGQDHPHRGSIACLVASIIAGRGYYEVHAPFFKSTRPGEFDSEIQREQAIVAEVQRIGVGALPSLIPFLTDSEAEVRATVAEALGCYPSRADELVPLLQRAVSVEEDENARERIQESLDRILAS
jgi:HEAT repeat protein